jgi:hypothetical protein
MFGFVHVLRAGVGIYGFPLSSFFESLLHFTHSFYFFQMLFYSRYLPGTLEPTTAAIADL